MEQSTEKELLLPGEQVSANFKGVLVNNQSGFSATVTNYRLLLRRTDVIHDIRLDAIAVLSCGRMQQPLWVLIVGVLDGLFGLVGLYYSFVLGFILLLLGGLIIALWFIYRRVKLDVYTTGAKSFSIIGQEETLFELYQAIRQLRRLMDDGEV